MKIHFELQGISKGLNRQNEFLNLHKGCDLSSDESSSKLRMVGPTLANGIGPIKDQKFAVSDEFKTPFWGNCMQNAAKIYI